MAGVNLIGHACFWRPDVEAALVGAFDGGLKLTGEGRVFVNLQVLGCLTSVIGGFELPQVSCRQAVLRFVSPVRLRSERATLISGVSLVISLANRVKSLAAWLSFKLEEDWPALHRTAWALATDCEALIPYRWDCGSRRASDRIPVLGFLGSMTLSGDLDAIIPYLMIGEAMNAGLGRYRLALLP